MRLGRIVKGFHQRMLLERGLNDSALHSSTTSVDESHFPQTRLVRRIHVLFNNRFDVLRAERMEIDRILNRDRAW